MNWTLEVVVVPVADVDRAKAFYADKLGFNVDHDISPPGPGNRLVPLTPPGSGCLASIGEGVVPHMPPCSLQRSAEHTPQLQSRQYLACRPLLQKKKPHVCTPYPPL